MKNIRLIQTLTNFKENNVIKVSNKIFKFKIPIAEQKTE